MEGGKPYVTDNDNYIVDLYFEKPIKDATQAAKEVPACLVLFVPSLSVRMIQKGGLSVCEQLSLCDDPPNPPPPVIPTHTPMSPKPTPHKHNANTNEQPNQIAEVVGVVEHGFFLDMTDAVIVAGKTGIEVINKK